MADKTNATTSSKSLEETTYATKANVTSNKMPTMEDNAVLVTKLAKNITDNYRLVKQRQPKFLDLTNQRAFESSTALCKKPTQEWQVVCSSKNKLKRKKTLSASLTSVTDSVNQEKRTRIEGMQLNCRGKLQIKENTAVKAEPKIGSNKTAMVKAANQQEKENVTVMPKVPAAATATTNNQQATTNATVAPPRLKRKLQENMQTIQKLNALTEQLRLEINELKSSLSTERGAVRVLRLVFSLLFI